MHNVPGYREVAHTADWELEVWAADLPGLLQQAALGMYALAGVRLQPGPRRTCSLTLQGLDDEDLLVKFLSELLYLGNQQGLAFDTFNLYMDSGSLNARLGGAPIASQDKEIKAVTYHQLAIRRGPHGLAANVVFDV